MKREREGGEERRVSERGKEGWELHKRENQK